MTTYFHYFVFTFGLPITYRLLIIVAVILILTFIGRRLNK